MNHLGWLKRNCHNGLLVPSMTYRELSLALFDGEAAVHWCQRHKLLSDSKMYPKCGTDMHLVKRKGTNLENMGWRCPRKAGM